MAKVQLMTFHYAVERQDHIDDIDHGPTKIVAQFHSVRDAERFIEATPHDFHRQRISCLTKRNRDRKIPYPWVQGSTPR